MRFFRVGSWVLVWGLTVASCTRRSPGLCCLTVEDCTQIDVSDGPLLCDSGLACVANQCVAGPDGASLDPCLVAGGQILFVTDRDGDTEIARIWADGTGFQQLTENSWPDDLPQLSPDGTKVAWISQPAGTPQLYVMNVDGSAPSNVSGSTAILPNLGAPRWAPDSRWILFVRTDEIVKIAPDGSNPLTISNITFSRWPDWSPDGSAIAFSTSTELHIVQADGTNRHALTGINQYSYPRELRWSHDGLTIVAFRESSVSPYAQDLWRVRPSGTDRGVMAAMPGSHLAWAPDSASVVFDEDDEIMLATNDLPSQLTNLTNVPASDQQPSWSPGGARILFQSDRPGNYDLYSMNSDGSDVMNLTGSAGNDTSAMWGECPQ